MLTKVDDITASLRANGDVFANITADSLDAVLDNLDKNWNLYWPDIARKFGLVAIPQSGVTPAQIQYEFVGIPAEDVAFTAEAEPENIAIIVAVIQIVLPYLIQWFQNRK
jgi:hypothetical protein